MKYKKIGQALWCKMSVKQATNNKPRRRWTPEEIAYLRRNVRKRDIATLADHLHRHATSVRVAIHALGLAAHISPAQGRRRPMMKAAEPQQTDKERNNANSF